MSKTILRKKASLRKTSEGTTSSRTAAYDRAPTSAPRAYPKANDRDQNSSSKIDDELKPKRSKNSLVLTSKAPARTREEPRAARSEKLAPRPSPTPAFAPSVQKSEGKIAAKEKQPKDVTPAAYDPEQLYRLFAICPGNLDDVLEYEVQNLGATILDVYPGGVEFEGNLETAYLACLSLRTASRVLLLLKDVKHIVRPDQLYDAIQTVDWTKVFSPESTFSIHFTETQTRDRFTPMNTQFWALKAKDAIVDQFRYHLNTRPSVDRQAADISIRLHLHDQILKIYLDLSGRSLHERGYRVEALEAPMKENLAAGLLFLAGWDLKCAEKIPLYDPYCGSGTLLIEAALMATDTAPNLYRNFFGFLAWKNHQEDVYQKVRETLENKRKTDFTDVPLILGSDMSSEAIEIAEKNIKKAGFQKLIKLQVARFQETTPPEAHGLIVTNPPYGVRLEELDTLVDEYSLMGSTFKHKYKGWTVAVITSEKELIHAIALKPSKKWTLYNGGLESKFCLFELY